MRRSEAIAAVDSRMEVAGFLGLGVLGVIDMGALYPVGSLGVNINIDFYSNRLTFPTSLLPYDIYA